MSTASFSHTSRSPRLRVFVVGVAAAAALSACSSNDATDTVASSTEPASGAPTSSQGAPAAVTVDVKVMAFKPASIEVKAGEKVTWKFDDGGVPHTVTGLGDAATIINSPILKEGEYSYTFDKPGTFDYTCSIHPDMKGTIVVR